MNYARSMLKTFYTKIPVIVVLKLRIEALVSVNSQILNKNINLSLSKKYHGNLFRDKVLLFKQVMNELAIEMNENDLRIVNFFGVFLL